MERYQAVYAVVVAHHDSSSQRVFDRSAFPAEVEARLLLVLCMAAATRGRNGTPQRLHESRSEWLLTECEGSPAGIGRGCTTQGVRGGFTQDTRAGEDTV